MLGLGIEVELEIADRIAAIREEGDLLIQLMALRFEDLEEPAFGFLVIGLDESKTFAGDGLLGLFPTVKGQEALARNHLEGALLSLGLHVAPIDSDGERAMGIGNAATSAGHVSIKDHCSSPKASSSRCATVST